MAPTFTRIMKTPIFPQHEYERRLASTRAEMDRRGLQALLVSSPENIYWLTGLDHQGFFAYHMLVVPLEGVPCLVTRAMERSVVRDQVPDLRFIGYSDKAAKVRRPDRGNERAAGDAVLATLDDNGRAAGVRPWDMSFGVEIRDPGEEIDTSAPVQATLQAVREVAADAGRVGMEEASTFLPFAIATGLRERLPKVEWHDASGLVDARRVVQSPLELERTRQAAVVSDSMMLSAIAAAGPGIATHDVMAAIYDTMFRRGGTYPGFVPLVRTTHTIEHEHGTWQAGRIKKGDLLFLEMAGCVRRYHAPLGRLAFIGSAPRRAGRTHEICRQAMERAAETIGPGVAAGEVYRAWHRRLEEAGLSSYTRHHCGYSVGIGFPPSWSGSGVPVGLRESSDLELRAGMVFHLMSWLLRTGKGDAFLSDTIVVTEGGCEFLTTVAREVTVR